MVDAPQAGKAKQRQIRYIVPSSRLSVSGINAGAALPMRPGPLVLNKHLLRVAC
jgi:hypothetical protein